MTEEINTELCSYANSSCSHLTLDLPHSHSVASTFGWDCQEINRIPQFNIVNHFLDCPAEICSLQINTSMTDGIAIHKWITSLVADDDDGNINRVVLTGNQIILIRPPPVAPATIKNGSQDAAQPRIQIRR